MSERNQENKRVKDWLTRDRPITIRTRGAVRTRGVVMPMPVVEVKGAEKVPGLLQQLNEEVPEVPWVVVVDGKITTFAKTVCSQAKEIRKSSKFWLVSEQPETSSESLMATLNALLLDSQNVDDLKFLKNLVADLVIVPSEPKPSQGERVRRWLYQARYILAEEPGESLIEEIRMSELAGGSKAEIFFIKGTD